MKRWILMLVALLVFALLPSAGTELGELCPAAVMFVRRDGMDIVVETDTGNSGRGTTLEAALSDLEDRTPGYIFLDTVENLIISGEANSLLPALQRTLRPCVRLCEAEELNMETAWEYLRVHTPQIILAEADGNSKLQKLTMEGEQYRLEDGECIQ